MRQQRWEWSVIITFIDIDPSHLHWLLARHCDALSNRPKLADPHLVDHLELLFTGQLSQDLA